MRRSARANGISVHAIAGAQSVLLAMNATEEARRDLLGFAIGRRLADGDVRWQDGFKFFRDLVPDPQPGETRSTREHPVQSFLWGHYTAEPDTTYDYVVLPLYRPDTGDLGNLQPGVEVGVRLRTEALDRGTHSIIFNRGAVPSQAFARRFGSRPPRDEDDPDAEDVRWLSRGLLKAALDFIGTAQSARYQLRVALYEFRYHPIMEALAAAASRGADVRIVYEAGTTTGKGVTTSTSATLDNEKAIDSFGLPRNLLIPRRNRRGILHNKFILLLEDGHPIQVWTGSTNMTPSGFLGQSNVGHVIRDEAVARAFVAYWENLAADIAPEKLQSWCSEASPEPGNGPPAAGMTLIFSPR